jgi:hypothetical protein
MKNLIESFKNLPTFIKIVLGLSLILFILSLTQTAFLIDREEDPSAYSDSLTLFLLGWMSFLGGAFIPFIIWLANPLFFLSIYLTIRNNQKALYASIGSTVLAFIFSQLKTIMTSESGSSSIITERGLGFKLWFTSFAILTVGLLIKTIIIHRKENLNK